MEPRGWQIAFAGIENLNMIVIPALYLKYGEAKVGAPARGYPREGEVAPAGD